MIKDLLCQQIFDLVNTAYLVEKGVDNLAFKNCDRYIDISDVNKDIAAGEYFITRQGDMLVGYLLFSIDRANRICHFGPFAVHPDHKGQGIGNDLLNKLEQHCQTHGIFYIDIEVVNHRADLIPYYIKRGYQEVGTANYDASTGVDENALTRPSHFLLFRKKL